MQAFIFNARTLSLLAIPLLLLGAYFIYAPGIDGAFILDDFPNLSGLWQVGDLQHTDGVLRFVFGNLSGTPDRWIAKASFLVDASTWPADPYSFKRTNILLHLINGTLVIWVVLQLMRMIRTEEKHAVPVALVTGTIWLLHPFNVSTTLYVVQRMTELATLFMLFGTLSYLKGRAAMGVHPVRGYVLASCGVAFGTGCAVLSKETGILLCLYLLSLELVLLRVTIPVARYWTLWKGVFLYFPILVVAAWHVINFSNILSGYTFRSFNVVERLLTQPRALADYIYHILLPQRGGTGVIHDDFTVSTGLFDPVTTLVSIVFLIVLVVTALYFRKRWPIYTFAVFWFFSGHVLESGIVSLELYFEHRNYMPMIGPIFALSYYALTTVSRLRRFLYIGLFAYVAMTVLSTWQNVRVWGNVAVNAQVWAEEHPDSARALQYASNFWIKVGAYDESQKRLERLIVLNPTWAGPKLKLLVLSCITQENRIGNRLESLAQNLDQFEWDAITVPILNNLFTGIKKRTCDYMSIEQLDQIIDQLILNKSYRTRPNAIANLHNLKGKIYGFRNQPLKQAEHLRKSFEWKGNWHIAIEESKVWASQQRYAEALQAVDRAKTTYFVGLKGFRLPLTSDELSGWENYLRDQLSRAG